MLEIAGRDYLQHTTELERLDELDRFAIAGTQPEARFDAITRAASALFRTPMAFLTLIEGDRQWFKSAVGMAVTESPRSVSFCTHTIKTNEVMVVADTLDDPRFAENPFVTGEPRVRFYAGAPLVTEAGFRLGTLCLADRVPRNFSDEQRMALRDLAALAMSQISARRHEASATALAGLAQSLGQPLLAVNPQGSVEFANQPAADFFELTMDDIKGVHMDQLISAGQLGMNVEGLIAVFEGAREGAVSQPFQRVATRGDGSEIPVEISVSPWRAANGTGIAVVLSSLAQKAGSELGRLKAGRQAPAADLAVVRVLNELAERDLPGTLFLVAIDGFGELCETLGRQMSNAALKTVAARLQRLLPQAAIIARAQSDDFAVIVKEVSNPSSARRVAQQILDSFEEVLDLGVRVLQMTASIGFAIGKGDTGSAGDLIDNAAFALREARRVGGRGMQVYDDALRMRSTERHQIRFELMQALKNDEFRLFYQPQVSLGNGRIHGVEALVRWQHPTRGLLMPADFLPDVEEAGLALPLGWWTLDAACAQLAQWRAIGRTDIRMGVNLFAAQFRSDRLVWNVMSTLERHQLAPSDLELEVTETIALLDDEAGLEACRQLRALGVQIAFDDFGTGYASLSSLQRFPLTTLKLDRTFVRNILTNANDAVITRSMIGMANDLGLETIAEGIETEKQEALLLDLGCRSGQGYLYSKPITACDMAAMLAQRDRGDRIKTLHSAACRI